MTIKQNLFYSDMLGLILHTEIKKNNLPYPIGFGMILVFLESLHSRNSNGPTFT